MAGRTIAVLVFVLALVAGCGTDSKQPFFKPEISGAVYAARAGDPTSDDGPQAVVKLPMPNPCYFTDEFGWSCWNDDNEIQLDDQAGGYYCAPRVNLSAKPVAAEPCVPYYVPGYGWTQCYAATPAPTFSVINTP